MVQWELRAFALLLDDMLIFHPSDQRGYSPPELSGLRLALTSLKDELLRSPPAHLDFASVERALGTIAAPFGASQIQGRWHDPRHPRGWREIAADGLSLAVTGQDGPGESSWRAAGFPSVHGDGEGGEFIFDFGATGGPLLGGRFVASEITWADGNRWTRTPPEPAARDPMAGLL